MHSYTLSQRVTVLAHTAAQKDCLLQVIGSKQVPFGTCFDPNNIVAYWHSSYYDNPVHPWLHSYTLSQRVTVLVYTPATYNYRRTGRYLYK
ncbi:MAG: hypothetical protein OYH77_01920 [Pseudomonadota bacterium]|nr:hypothetical protein [Pseudomonadota bacterium]